MLSPEVGVTEAVITSLVLLIINTNTQEWGTSCPHTFLGGYRLEADMSWTPSSKVDKKDSEMRLIHQILDGYKTLSAALESGVVDRKPIHGQITFN